MDLERVQWPIDPAGAVARARQGLRPGLGGGGARAAGTQRDPEQIERILSEVKERSLADKGLLDDDRFLEIVDRVV